MNNAEVMEFIESLTLFEARFMLAGLSGRAPDAFAVSVASIERIREAGR